METSGRINNKAKYTKFGDNGARKMKFDSFDDREDGELTYMGLVEMSRIFTTQGDMFLRGNDVG